MPRACDRCYAVKSSCVYTDATTCTRCARLKHECLSVRPVRKPGRPVARFSSSSPQQIDDGSSTSSQEGSPPKSTSPEMSVGKRLSNLPQNYQRHELALINFLLQPEQIASLLYGNSFTRDLLESMAAQFFSADEKLKYGLLALATSISKTKCVEHLNTPASGHENSSRALAMYSRSSITSLEDAKVILALALSLVTYNDLSLGLPTLPIARSALLRVKPWRFHLLGRTREETDPCFVCVLFVELFECLLMGQLPVFRYESIPGNTVIDLYYGISHELLPQFYDICQIYATLKEFGSQSDPNFANQVLNSVNQWDPDAIMLQRGLALSQDEYQHYLRQARCFQYTAQLLLSQTQTSLYADSLSKLKATQLGQEIQQIMLEGKGRPKYLLFPYFVACIELGTPTPQTRQMIKDTMEEISNGMASQACQSMIDCLEDIWRNRKIFPDLPWFQCISSDQMIVMGP